MRAFGISIQYWNYTHKNVHGLFKDFYSKLEGSVNRHAPLKKLSPKEIKIKSKPWLNLLRNRINRDLKKSKKQYYEQYFTEHVNNIKKTWDCIKKIVNLKRRIPIELHN